MGIDAGVENFQPLRFDMIIQEVSGNCKNNKGVKIISSYDTMETVEILRGKAATISSSSLRTPSSPVRWNGSYPTSRKCRI